MPLSRSGTAATIPASVLGAVLHALHEHGDTTPIQCVQRVKGGYESTSVRVTTRRRHYFLKWAPAGAQGGFQAEAAHLSVLAATGAIAVPVVLRWSDHRKH